MKRNLIKKPMLLVLIVFFVFISCVPFTARFSPYVYQQAISLKVESLTLMDKATENFSKHKSEVEKFKTKLEIAYEYAKGIPNNTFSKSQWEILISPDRNLLGGFLKKWEKNTKLNPVFINERKDQVAKAFDKIIKLETKKIKQ